VGYGHFKRFGFPRLVVATLVFFSFLVPSAFAQIQQQYDEIVTSLTGGRVILHVAKDDTIFFAAIDQPVNSLWSIGMASTRGSEADSNGSKHPEVCRAE
jgi:hypothetical protein